MSRRQYTGLAGWLGGGPWLVLDECPADRHNTLSASKGRFCTSRGRSVSGRPKCICPRARWWLARENEQRRRSEQERGVNRNNIRVPSFMSNTLAQGMPDLRAGKCRSKSGREKIDAAEGRLPTSKEVLEARFMCAECPVFDACGDWVTRDEKPAGSWGLMYAGMTPRERIRQATARRRGMRV
jgi:hypothetical protein